MTRKLQSTLIIFFLFLNIYTYCNGAYEIWLIPEKYKINEGESIRVRFGITGYGDIDIYNSKFCIYSEKETLIAIDGSTEKKYEIFTSILNPIPGAKTPLYDIYNKENVVQGIALKSDYLTDFKDIIAYPRSSGGKKLVFIFTYKSGEEWKIISKEFNYHVNTWSEKNEKYLSWVYLFGAILTFLAFTPNNYLSSFLKKCFLKLKNKRHLTRR